ncbi:MAG: hypothetical protein AAF787_16200, partial [Chloroflexota bacterium]
VDPDYEAQLDAVMASLTITDDTAATEPETVHLYIGLYSDSQRWIAMETEKLYIRVLPPGTPGTEEMGPSIELPVGTDEITISVHADRHITINGDTRFTLPTNQPFVQPLDAMGTWSGDGTIKLQVFANGQPMAGAFVPPLEIAIARNPALLKDRPALPPPFAAADTGNFLPDVTLRLYTFGQDNEPSSLRIYGKVFSPHQDPDGRHIGYRDVPMALIDWIHMQMEDIAMASGSTAHGLLRELGRTLWDDVLPPGLFTEYWRMMGSMRRYGHQSLLIIADEYPWLPYELATPFIPYNPDRSDPWHPSEIETLERTPLCETFAVTRWVEGTGQARRSAFPLGPVQPIFSADIPQGDIRSRDPIRFGQKQMRPEQGMSLSEALYASHEANLFHIVKGGGNLSRRVVGIEKAQTSESWIGYVNRQTQNMQSKSPLITQTSLIDATGNTPVNPDELIALVNSGASVVVGTWWGVSPSDDRVFWQTFYQQIIVAAASVGEAAFTAREAVRRISTNPISWLAYYVIGDPMATGYEPKDSIGYIDFSQKDATRTIHIGQSAIFLIKLQQHPPAHYNGPRKRSRPWSASPFELMIRDSDGFEVKTQPVLTERKPDSLTWEVELKPNRHGEVHLLLQINEPGTPHFAIGNLKKEVKQGSFFGRSAGPMQKPETIVLDLWHAPYRYYVGKDEYTFGTLRPDDGRVEALRADIKQVMRGYSDTSIEDFSHRISSVVKEMMPDWPDISTFSTISIVDKRIRLPWEFAKHPQHGYWGTSYCIGHVFDPKISAHAASPRVTRITLLDDGHLNDLATHLKAHLPGHVYTGRERIDPPELTPTALSRICKLQNNTLARIFHMDFTLTATGTLALHLSDDDMLELTPGDWYSKVKIGFRASPVIILTVRVTDTDTDADLTNYARMLMKHGAGAVIMPHYSFGSLYHDHFPLVFHRILAQHSSPITLGALLMEVREHMAAQFDESEMLSHILVGDPGQQLQLIQKIQSNMS